MGTRRPLTLLLVEDDPGDAYLVEIALRNAAPSYRVHRAASLKEALAARQSDSFDAILLDLSLPDSCGFKTVTAIREAYPGSPIVVLTGLDDPVVEDHIVEYGAQDYLVKGGFDDQSLMRAIQHAVVRHELERRLIASESEHRTVVNLAPDAILVVAPDGAVCSANPAADRMFGATLPGGLIGMPVQALLPEANPLREACRQGTESRGDGMGVNGAMTFPVSMALASLGDDRVLVMVRDITERTRMTLELQQLARMDPLTGLANRRTFAEQAKAEFLRCKRFGSAAGLLMVDVDHFKKVNDVHGHDAGDRALCALAAVLSDTLRATDLAARYGGEEFVVLLVGADMQGTAEMAEHIRTSLSCIAMQSPAGDFTFTVSIGASIFSTADPEWNSALHRADRGLYQSKSAGRNRVTVVEPIVSPSINSTNHPEVMVLL